MRFPFEGRVVCACAWLTQSSRGRMQEIMSSFPPLLFVGSISRVGTEVRKNPCSAETPPLDLASVTPED